MCDFICFLGGYLNKIAAYLLSDKRLVVYQCQENQKVFIL